MDKKEIGFDRKPKRQQGTFSHISSFDRNIPPDIPLVTDKQLWEIIGSIREEISALQNGQDIRIEMVRSYGTGIDDRYILQRVDGTIWVDYDILTEVYPYLDPDNMRRKLMEDILFMIGAGHLPEKP